MSQSNPTESVRSVAPLFTQLDATLGTAQQPHHAGPLSNSPVVLMQEQTSLLRDVLTAMDRNNELLEELVNHVSAAQKQRNIELNQWKQANPNLSKNCRVAADALTKVQAEYLNEMTREITNNSEDMIDGEFVFNEFIDRFGPRMAHLNGVLQVLSHLGATPPPAAPGV